MKRLRWHILKTTGLSPTATVNDRHVVGTYATAGGSCGRGASFAVLLLVLFGHSESDTRVSARQGFNILQCFVGFWKGVDDIPSFVTSAIAGFFSN